MSTVSGISITRIVGWLLLTIVLLVQSVVLERSQLVVGQVCASELQAAFLARNAPNGVLNPWLGCDASSPPIVVKQVSASAAQAPHIPQNTLDSDLNSRWSADGNEQRIKYDLGESKVLSHVAIAFYQGDQRQYRFHLEVSDDDSNWSTVRGSVLSSGITRNLEKFEFDVPEVKARYIAYVGEGNTSEDGNNSLSEFRIYRGEVQPPALAVKQVRASSHQPELSRNTLDGDLNTRWSAPGKGQWIEYDLGERKHISHVGIIFDQRDQRIAGFNVLAYDDPNDQSSWVTVLADGQSSGIAHDLQTFDFADVQNRYMRYVGQGNSLDEDNSLIEVRIYGGEIAPLPFESIADVKASKSEAGTDAGNTLDNNLNTAWIATGSDQWIYYDLGSLGEKIIDRVDIAFYKGDERSYRFQLQISDDAINWRTVLKNGQSSGTQLDRESFDVADVKARFLRYLGQGYVGQDNSVTQANGLTAVQVFQGELQPNLVVSSGPPSVSPRAVASGDAIRLSAWTVENCGGVATGDFEYGFYLSADALIDINDTWIDGKQITSLEPGAVLNIESPQLKIPAATPAGSYYLGILVDRANAVDESSEWNNFMSTKITVKSPPPPPQLPDLRVSSVPRLGSSNSVEQGGSITLDWTVMNAGAGAASKFSYDFYLSSDKAIGGGDTRIKRSSHTGLGPNQSKSFNRQKLKIPVSTKAGSYHVCVSVDRNKAIKESNENNNGACSARKVTVKVQTPKNLPDLKFFSILFFHNGIEEIQPGGTFTVNVGTVENAGTGPAPGFTIAYYLSRDDKFSPRSDIFLADKRYGELAPGKTLKLDSPKLKIPKFTKPGLYYVLIVGDPNNNLSESNDKNNFVVGKRIRVISKEDKKPDLVITDQKFHLIRLNVKPGGSFKPSLSFAVKNAGTGPAPSFTIGYYLSQDSKFNSSDKFLRGESRSGLAPGESFNVIPPTLKIPESTKPGTYNVVI